LELSAIELGREVAGNFHASLGLSDLGPSPGDLAYRASSDLNGEELEEFSALMQKNTAK
jgi:hypothetical protein